MYAFRRSVTALTAVAACMAMAAAAKAQPPRAPLALEPIGSTGEAVWPAFESWARNEDGTLTLLMGYMNRNDEVVVVPIGDDNHMGPFGSGDMGQPTHFLAGRHIGVFSVVVSEEQAQQKLTWTLRVNNQVSEIAFTNHQEYYADPFLDLAEGNVPPTLRVGPAGAELQGPPHGIAASYTATVGEPLTLLASASDELQADEPESPEPPPGGAREGRRPRAPLSVTWKKFRGSGEVIFEAEGIDASSELTHSFDDVTGGETITMVTFSEPGQYRLMAISNDASIAPGEGSSRQCCWTTAHVDVLVNP